MTDSPRGETIQSQSWQEQYPFAEKAIAGLLKKAPMFRGLIDALRAKYGQTFYQRADQRTREIEHLIGNDDKAFESAVQSYVHFCMEFAQKQQEFQKTGQYSYQNYDQIVEDLYAKDEVMQNYYLIALLFSFVFSPNYYEFFDFFETVFLSALSPEGVVAEIGCGHGLYLTRSLDSHAGRSGIGIDISHGALEVAERMLTYYGVDSARYQLHSGDLRGRTPLEDASADAVICCEVLEHLPDPSHAVAELRRTMREGAVLMLSAAIRMESVDHLFVFQSHEEVAELIRRSGLQIESDRAVPLTKELEHTPEVYRQLLADPTVPVGYICLARAI